MKTDSYDVIYDGEAIWTDISFAEAISRVGKDYVEYKEDVETHGEDCGDFDFEGYAIYKHIPVNLREIFETNHRGTFPKSWRAEGENFID